MAKKRTTQKMFTFNFTPNKQLPILTNNTELVLREWPTFFSCRKYNGVFFLYRLNTLEMLIYMTHISSADLSELTLGLRGVVNILDMKYGLEYMA